MSTSNAQADAAMSGGGDDVVGSRRAGVAVGSHGGSLQRRLLDDGGL